MRTLIPILLAFLISTNAPAECSSNTVLAKVDGKEITLSYFKYVEETIPNWALNKYYGGNKGKEKLLEKIAQRTLILVDAERKGAFKKEPLRSKVKRFEMKRLAYEYINERLKNVKVSDEEIQKALQKYPPEERKKRLKSVKASLMAKKIISEREKVISNVKRRIEVINPSPKKPDDVVGKVDGKEVRFSEISPLISGKPNKKKIERALETYALYKLALKENLDRREEFKNSLRAFKEKLAVKEFEREILSSVKVTDEEIKNYYEKHKSEFKAPGTAKVKIFVFESEEEAKRSLSRLKKGEREERAIPENSLKTAREWLVSSEDKNNPVSLLVFSSKERYNILKMPNGKVLLIEVLEKKEPKPLPYGDAYSRVKSKLFTEKARSLFKKRMEELKRKYGEEIYRENLRCAWKEESN